VANRGRFSAAEARKEVIGAGLDILQDKGLEPGLSRVTLNDAIAAAGVPRPSAYRVFTRPDNSPQNEFRAAVLLSLIERFGATAQRSIDMLIGKGGALAEMDNPVHAASALREMVRVVSLAKAEEIKTALGAGFATSLIATAIDPEPDSTTAEAFEGLFDSITDGYANAYANILRFFGLRARPQTSLKQVATLIVQAADVTLLQNLPSFASQKMRPTGPDDEMQEWNTLGIIIEGYILTLLMPDTDAEVSADLRTWVT